MIKKNKNHSIDVIFVLMAALIFAASVLLLLTLGGGAYANVSAKTRLGGEDKLALSFIATKIRQGDAAGMLRVRNLDGIDALSITEEYGGYFYETVIYVHDGSLKELFYSEGFDFYPEDGEVLLAAANMTLTPINDDLLQVKFSADSGVRTVLLSMRSEGRWHNE